MRFSKASLRVAGLILGTICLHACGPDPRSQFAAEVEEMIGNANAGRHGELENRISGALDEKIRSEGWEPRAALLAVARMDRQQKAAYRLSDVPRFEARSYAEAEVIRSSIGDEKRIMVPFVWEEGGWRAGAAYRDGRAWEEEF